MPGVARRVFQPAGVFKKQPAEFAARLVHVPIITHSGQRQLWQEFLVNDPLDRCGQGATPFCDDGRAIRRDAVEPIDGRLAFESLELQDFDALRLDALRLKLAPGLDRPVLEQVFRQDFGCDGLRHRNLSSASGGLV